MEYVCPICHATMERELMTIISHGDSHILDVIKKKHPDWTAADGLCPKCYEYYKKQLRPSSE